MSMMQEWAQTVHHLMSCFEDTMEVLSLSDHKSLEGKDPRTSEPEQSKHHAIGLPSRQVTDQTHASESLSNLRAQFQNVSCHLHESLTCSCGSHALILQRRPGPGGVSAGAMPLGSHKLYALHAALSPDAHVLQLLPLVAMPALCCSCHRQAMCCKQSLQVF